MLSNGKELSWEGFVSDERVMHNHRLAEVTVVPPECVPSGCVPIRYDDAPIPYVVVSSQELVRVH